MGATILALGIAAILDREQLSTIFKLGVAVKREGFLDKVPERNYDASTKANLTAIYKGLTLYHESEGQFPKSSEWMDAIKSRIQTSDMSEAEAAKKLIDPSLEGKPGAYGYAMNDAASGKYKGDIQGPKTPLIFMSSDTARNAHGDPTKLAPNPPRPGGNYAVTVDGSILKM